MNYHKPVLLNESLDSLEIRGNGVYVDMTYGGGGHSREILNRLGSNGKLIAFDQDLDSQSNIIVKPIFKNILIKKYQLFFIPFHPQIV